MPPLRLNAMQAHATQLKGTVIALVNPRLHSFRHPVLLAAAVVCISMPFVVGLIVFGLRDCVQECTAVPLSEAGAYETCKTVARVIPDVATTLKPTFSYLAKDSPYRIFQSHEGRAYKDGRPFEEKSTIDGFLNQQSTKQGWGVSFLGPTSRLIPDGMDGSFGKDNNLKGLTFVPPSPEVLADPSKHSWSYNGHHRRLNPDDKLFSWEFTYDVDASTVNSEQNWVKGEPATAPTTQLRPDADLFDTAPFGPKADTKWEISKHFLFTFAEEDQTQSATSMVTVQQMFLKEVSDLHRDYGLASRVTSQRVKVPEKQAAVLSKMKIQFIREDPLSFEDSEAQRFDLPINYESDPFYRRKDRESLRRRRGGVDLKRKLKVCWVYDDATQTCMSFKIDDLATQISSSVCPNDYTASEYSSGSGMFSISRSSEICIHGDAVVNWNGRGTAGTGTRAFNGNAGDWATSQLSEVITTSVPWFFERTWNYSTPLMQNRLKRNDFPVDSTSVCPLMTLCDNYPFGPPTERGGKFVDNVDTIREGIPNQEWQELALKQEENAGISITNPFTNVCELHMYMSDSGNNVQYTTLSDLEKLHTSINKMTVGQKFEYQLAQYSGAIQSILQSPEYVNLATLQADSITSYCCAKVCPGVTTAVGAALGYTAYIELVVTFIILLCYQFLFGGGYADGEGPEKLTMAAKLKLALSIAAEEEKDQDAEPGDANNIV